MRPQLIEGHVGKQLIRLTLPMLWGNAAVLISNLADTYFVAQLGSQQLAAMSFTFPVVMVLGSVAVGLSTGTLSLIARTVGGGYVHRLPKLTTHSLWLSSLVVGILSFLGWISINPLFRLLGATPDVLSSIRDYLQIYYFGMICLIVLVVGNSVSIALGNTVIPSLLLSVVTLINIGLDPLLIFGWNGFPALGIRGAALATVVSEATVAMACLAILHYRQGLLNFHLPSVMEVCQDWKSLLHVGLPAILTNLMIPVSSGAIISLIASYGTESVAGFGLASRLEAGGLILLKSLSTSISPFVGQNWGAKQFARIRRALNLSFVFCLIWGGLFALLFQIAGGSIVAEFNQNPAVIASANAYLTIVPPSYGVLGVILITSSSFNAVGQPLLSVAIALSRLLLLYLPLAYLGSRWFGLLGIFGAACLSNLIIGLSVYFWNRRTFKKFIAI